MYFHIGNTANICARTVRCTKCTTRIAYKHACMEQATLADGGREGGALSQRDRNHPPYAPLIHPTQREEHNLQ